ncbi:Flp/Fap pilin component [compost metagenome]|uniref:Flp family type IVb pilin n=2 Tax=Variovorax boronicumulans TaxID=436515 RepID=A0A250DRM5_9BURK|nr:Flp family type IVb pilin [Variovorax boronicumulans]ATA56649.1 Flp family type IVb pilin [Variovorax boronicumulans]
MLSSITRFLRDEEGATAIEYGMIAGIISVGILAFLPTIGTKLAAIFESISTLLP